MPSPPLSPLQPRLLLAVAAGGALGSLARWGLTVLLPHADGDLPVATLLANVTGAFALGLLMPVVLARGPRARLLRAFWGVGLVSGYTTYSTAMLDVHALLSAGSTGLAAGYLLGSVAAGLAAVAGGAAVTNAVRGRSR